MYGSVFENASDQPAVLVKTSEVAGLSEMMVVASPVAVRSKVSVPVVVSWPDGVTVTGWTQKQPSETFHFDHIAVCQSYLKCLDS